MDTIDPAKFRATAKQGLCGGYLFFGEEEYLKRNSLELARKSILGENAGDSFNHVRFDGESFSLDALENAIISLPVFANKKLVEIHCLSLRSYKESQTEQLVSVLSLLSENPQTVLILYTAPYEFEPGDKRRPSKQFKALSGVLCPVICEKQSREKLAKWVCAHFHAGKVMCSHENSLFLIARAGSDMFTLASEIEKLCAYVLACGRDCVEEEDILLLASKNRENGAFDFANAILNRDTEKAFYILSGAEQENKKRDEINLTMGSIISIFRLLYRISVLANEGANEKEIASQLKINEYRCSLYRRALGKRTPEDIEAILDLCREADALLKSGAHNGYTVLSRLIIEAAQ